jgi:hypothetical protein
MVNPILEGKVVKRKTTSFDEEVFDKINNSRKQVGFSTWVNAHFRKFFGLDKLEKKKDKKPTINIL